MPPRLCSFFLTPLSLSRVVGGWWLRESIGLCGGRGKPAGRDRITPLGDQEPAIRDEERRTPWGCPSVDCCQCPQGFARLFVTTPHSWDDPAAPGPWRSTPLLDLPHEPSVAPPSVATRSHQSSPEAPGKDG